LRKKKEPQVPIIPSTFDYESIAENAHAFLSSTDNEGIIVYANDFLCSRLGYSKQEVLGSHAYQYISQFNIYGGFQWNRIQELLAHPKDRNIRTLELRCKNGELIWIEWRDTIMTDSVTGVSHAISVGIEVTSTHLAKWELKNLSICKNPSVIFNIALKSNIPFTEVCRYAHILNIEISTPLVCCLLNSPRTLPDKNQIDIASWALQVTKIMNEALSEGNKVVWKSADGIALLVFLRNATDPETQVKNIINNIFAALKKEKSFVKTPLGISDIFFEPENISIPYGQALESAQFGPFIRPDNDFWHWKDLGLLNILRNVPSSHGDLFIKQKLGPVLSKKMPLKTEFLSSLSEILISKSISDLACRLHVHPKTIAYRKDRLEKLLGTDFDDPLTRSDLLLALQLYQIMSEENRNKADNSTAANIL